MYVFVYVNPLRKYYDIENVYSIYVWKRNLQDHIFSPRMLQRTQWTPWRPRWRVLMLWSSPLASSQGTLLRWTRKHMLWTTSEPRPWLMQPRCRVLTRLFLELMRVSDMTDYWNSWLTNIYHTQYTYVWTCTYISEHRRDWASKNLGKWGSEAAKPRFLFRPSWPMAVAGVKRTVLASRSRGWKISFSQVKSSLYSLTCTEPWNISHLIPPVSELVKSMCSHGCLLYMISL